MDKDSENTSAHLYLLLPLFIALLAFCLYFIYLPYCKQKRILETWSNVSPYVNELEDTLNKDGRFEFVGFAPNTAGNGEVIVVGEVDDDKALSDLRRTISDSGIPGKIIWLVDVRTKPVPPAIYP